MKVACTSILVLLVMLWQGPLAYADQEPDRSFRLVSWNISGDSFVTHGDSFLAIMRHTRPDVLVLDEVLPSATSGQLQEMLTKIDPQDERPWNVDYGASGGRQRGVIASRLPIERSFAFTGVIPYPPGPRETIAAQMTEQDHQWIRYSMEGGIPVNGAIVVVDEQRLLVVAVDLQCCGGAADDWQEFRRQLEAKVINRLINTEFSLRKIDAIVLAGDLNAVATNYPVELLMGGKKAPQNKLLHAEILHLDGSSTWTWDGRSTPFASSILDYQFYSAAALVLVDSYVFDSEDLDAETLTTLELQPGTSRQMSRHRPLVADYSWR